jgi:hypothetical protein
MAGSARRRFLRRGATGWAAVAALLVLRVESARALDSARVPPALAVRALRLAEELSALKLVDEAALARLLAVRLELRRGRVEPAAAQLRQVPAPRLITPLDHRMLLRLCRAELAVAQGNRRRALAHARAGLDELGQVRDRLGGLELVSGAAVYGQELGDLAVRLVLEGGGSDAGRLFGWLERTRAQAYRYQPLSREEVPARTTELVLEIRNLSRLVQLARLEDRPTGDLETRMAGLQREARRLGWHTSRWGRPRPVAGVAEVSARLGRRALVSFATFGNTIAAVVLVAGRAHLVRLGSAEQAVESARRLHADLNALAPDHLPAPLVAAIAGSARRETEKLDAQLVRPLADLLGDRDVVIVPTGALYAVPWGVLDTLRSRPVLVAPSATAWLASAGARGRASHQVVLVQGPGLSAARGEIGKLATHHRTALVLTEQQATVGAVLEALDGADLAHIAAHGAHEPDNALFSRLDLQDGALFAHETARLRRPPGHVVLAACELALHRIRPGDEALGFAGALLAGGVRTVVAAVSKVGDEQAAAAMDDYHRALAAGASPAVALADAVAVDPLRRPFVCLGSGEHAA